MSAQDPSRRPGSGPRKRRSGGRGKGRGDEDGPKAYRRVVRDLAEGRDAYACAERARRIENAAYAARGLVAVAFDRRIPPAERDRLVKAALERVDEVRRTWLRAEVLAEFLDQVQKGPDLSGLDALVPGVLVRIQAVEPGEGLSQAIQGAAPKAPIGALPRLLDRALANPGFERDDAKAVVRAWVEGVSPRGNEPLLDLRDRLMAIEDPELRARLLAYLHLQVRRRDDLADDPAAWRSAVHAAAVVEDPGARVGTLRYLASQAESMTELRDLAGTLDADADPETAAHLLATLGGRADRLGDRAQAVDWFRAGLVAAGRVADPARRAKIGLKIAEGFERADKDAHAEAVRAQAAKEAERVSDPGEAAAIERRIARSTGEEEPRAAQAPPTPVDTSERRRDTLALYDTYEGGLKSTHYRAVARAAPLCDAFGLGLALMGFPTDDLDDLVDRVSRETGIGGGGRHLRALHAAGRVHLVPCTPASPPSDWSAVGYPVATTPRPADAKRVSLAEAKVRAGDGFDGRICLVMGLGRRGLPRNLLETTEAHYEITGADVSLETATAMGILADRLRAVGEAGGP